MQLLKKLNKIFSRRQKSRLLIILMAIIFGAALETVSVSLVTPLLSLMMNEQGLDGNTTLSVVASLLRIKTPETMIMLICLGIAFIYIFKSVYNYQLYKVQYGYMFKIESDLRKMLFDGYLGMPYTYHTHKNPSVIVQLIAQDAFHFNLFIQSLMFLISEIITTFFLLTLLLFVSPLITLCLLVIVAICAIFFFFVLRKKSIRAGNENRIARELMYKDINQALGGIKEIKAFNRQGFFSSSFQRHNMLAVKSSVENSLWGQTPRLMIEAVSFGGIMLSIAAAIGVGAKIESMLPQLGAFALAAFRLIPAVNRAIGIINSIFYTKPSVAAIYADLDEIREAEPVIPEVKGDLNPLFGDIVLSDVTFTYPETSVHILDKVSMTILHAQSVAFIGASGAGKTTLADLILGVLKPDSGTITYDGMNIHKNIPTWLKHVGYIPQHIYLLDDTILNNVAFGIPREQINIDRVWDALKKAQVDDFVRSLEHGLDTAVGDRGIRLSGGQRQRIGIARALYHDPPVLILDEATSSLDNETEEAVMDAIQSFHGQKTLLIIAHRLSTIEYCDIVYRVGDGKVVEGR